MLFPAEINEIVVELAERLKAKKTDYNPIYEEAVALADEAKVHSRGEEPMKIVKDHAPNESKEEFEYRMQSHEPTTLKSWSRALGELNRIYSKQNYQVIYNDNEEELPLKEYLENEYPVHDDFFDFMSSVELPMAVEDANGIVLVTLFERPLRVDFDSNGEPIISADQSEVLMPVVKIYTSENVIEFTSQYAVYLTEDKSFIRVGDVDKQEGLVFGMIDDTNEYRITQTGAKHEWQFEVEIWFAHNWSEYYKGIPVWKMRGIPVHNNERELYQSYFYNAIPDLNSAVFDDLSLRGSKTRCAFPVREYEEEDCPNPRCEGRGFWIDYDGADETNVTCPDCKGTGLQSRFSPFTDYVHKKNDDREGEASLPRLYYHAPDTDILDFLRKEVNTYVQNSFLALNMNVGVLGNTPNGQDMTATEVLVDRESFQSWMLNISNNQWAITKNLIKAIVVIRYSGEVERMPQIITPNEFSILTAKDFIGEFSLAMEKGLPETALRHLLKKYMDQAFKGDSQEQQKLQLVFAVDPLLFKTQEEINAMVALKRISKKDDVINTYKYLFIDQMVEDDGDVFSLSMDIIMQRFDEKVQSKVAELGAQNGVGTPESIVEGI